MASSDSTVTVTAACELGRHDKCRGRIISLTETNGQPCECPTGCHGIVRDLPAAWAEQVALFPPCDGDVALFPPCDGDVA